MNYSDDVIAAIASGLTQSGIGIIRLSGSHVLDVVKKIFKPYHKKIDIAQMKTYTAHYGFIVDPDDNDDIVDECIILYMKGPHSYTGEDTVEIDVHGGTYLCQKTLELICRHGARLAEPGEYSKRAFLNGRMDLTQAEAVMDVIAADNENALKNSVKQLKGDLKEQIVKMRDQIIHENAYIEYALDDPEHVSLERYPEKLKKIVNELIEKLQKFIDSAGEGRLVKEGLKTVIVGKPNAGKSSLLNVLLKEERAIVTNVPGTTRDTLEEHAIVGGIPLNIVDTAGIHNTDDVVEKIGVDKAIEVIEDADLILYVVDATQNLTKEDQQIIEKIKEKKVIVLLNKSDLNIKIKQEEILQWISAKVIVTSMTEQSGMEEFVNVLKDMFFQGELSMNQEVMITNNRQKQAMEKALESLKQVLFSIENGMSEDFYTIDLMDSYEQLGYIIGESVNDDLVNEIFKDFCTGK